MKTFCSVLSILAISFCAIAAPTEVTIVTGGSPDPLEKIAADELAGLLKTLFDADAKIADSVPSAAENIILLGSPESNPAIPKDAWPKSLSDQGQVLKSTSQGLILGGTTDVATLWAVYEFGHSFGMRYLLHEDFPPIASPEFSLAGFDAVMEPNVKNRSWRLVGVGLAGQESWGLEDQKKLIKQLAKLKFNRVTMVFPEGDAFASPEIPVTGDTAGRSVFDGAKVFGNPDLLGKTDRKERAVAMQTMIEGVVVAAKTLGMECEVEAGTTAEPALVKISLSQAKGGLLPQFSTASLPEKLEEARNSAGFDVNGWIIGDLNPDIYFLSRASFDAETTPAKSLDSLVTPICGDGVAERLANGFAAIEEVAALIDQEDANFAVPDPKMFMEHYESGKPVPEWWAKAKEHFGTATNEMYRGNTRARGGARPFILYHAKRFFFSLHYMTSIEHARLAGIAREEKDNEAWVENLELSIESMHNALGIYAEVAKDQSDRGVIAILNEFAYRPLLEALDETPLP